MRDTQEWIWRGIKVVLPANWEMLQFSRRRAAGRCAFADRHQFRFELNWRELPAAPDMTRLMTDYRAKLTNEGTLEQAALTELPGWHGLAGRQGTEWTTRYGRFFPAASCLVEAVVICPGSRDRRLEQTVVERITHEGARDGLQPWKAFGMAILAPASSTLDECTVQPAHAALQFSHRRHDELLCQRSGMLDQWLTVPVEKWMAVQTPPDTRNIQCVDDMIDGHALHRVRAERPARNVLRSRRAFSSAGWVCPRDGRLYYAAHTGSMSNATSAAQPALSCCPTCVVRL